MRKLMSSHMVYLGYIRISWRTPFSRSAPVSGGLVPLSAAAAVAAVATKVAATRNVPRIPLFIAHSSYLVKRKWSPRGVRQFVRVSKCQPPPALFKRLDQRPKLRYQRLGVWRYGDRKSTR